MKKYASILAVLVLLLGFAAISYSAPAEIPSDTTAVIAKGKTQITLGGELRFRGYYFKNTSDLAAENTENKAGYDYRVILNMEAKVSPNTTGYVELQSGTTNDDNVKWGTSSSSTVGAKGIYREGNTNESSMYIRQAWIQYQGSGLLGVPAGVKVGKQLLKLGNGLFFDHTYFGDDAILAFVQPVKELTIGALMIKLQEDTTTLNDDSTAYSLLGVYAGKGWGLSADVTYVDDQKFLTPNSADLLNLASGYQNVNVPIHLWNIGLRGNVDDIAGTGLNFRADVEFQTGKVDASKVGADDLDFKGWAAMAGLDYNFKTIPLKLTLEYAIGSGDDNQNDNDIKTFITTLGNEQHYTFVYEYLAPTAANYGAGTYTRTGLANTQYVKLGGAYDITKDLKAELYGYWLRAVKDVAINGYTTKDKDLGWEVDAKVTYQIDKGLTYFIEGGYLWPGDAYKLSDGKDADDAWAVRHGITLKF
ncbi:alginate export family protein [Thermodesulfovibrio yellowstonii]|uniref:alginate export family protein n=1 Tax=Thermodesulfovibrio yellowstonii TaxID=28262 RepID=UPI0003F8065D|nr:alginate export family protein [Thermodesulfovibrio islandicus]